MILPQQTDPILITGIDTLVCTNSKHHKLQQSHKDKSRCLIYYDVIVGHKKNVNMLSLPTNRDTIIVCCFVLRMCNE